MGVLRFSLARETSRAPMLPQPHAVHYALWSDANLWVQPGERVQVPVGVVVNRLTSLHGPIEIRFRTFGALAVKAGVSLLAPHALPRDFTGEVVLCLINNGAEPFRVQLGAQVAEMYFAGAEAVAMAYEG